MKRLLLLAVFALGLGTQAWAQPPTSSDLNVDPNAPVMTFEKTSQDFGTVVQGAQVEKTYKFTNTGKQPLVITSATGSCHCTVPDFPKEPIMPGKSAVITVRFDSNGKMGGQDKTATITSNNRDGVVVIHLTGTVVAPDAAPKADPKAPMAPTNTDASQPK